MNGQQVFDYFSIETVYVKNSAHLKTDAVIAALNHIVYTWPTTVVHNLTHNFCGFNRQVQNFT